MNTFLVFILQLFYYLPSSFIVYLAFTGVIIPRKVFATVFLLIFLNSSFNPVLYCWRDRQIRTAVKQLFCRWFYAKSEVGLFLKVGYYDEICICPVSAVSVEYKQVVYTRREMPFANFKYLFFPEIFKLKENVQKNCDLQSSWTLKYQGIIRSGESPGVLPLI